MKYFEKILEILKKATEEELERVYHFIKAYIKGEKKE